jgi:hypothetical protein
MMRIMKTTKTIFTVILSAFTFLMSNAQNETDQDDLLRFAGLWQLCGNLNGLPEIDPATGEPDINFAQLRMSNSYKIFGKGGEFTAISIASLGSIRIVITGSFEVVSGNRYIEHVDYHSNPDFANRPTELGYVFFAKDSYYISSYELSPGRIVSEIYKLISPPVMVPAN